MITYSVCDRLSFQQAKRLVECVCQVKQHMRRQQQRSATCLESGIQNVDCVGSSSSHHHHHLHSDQLSQFNRTLANQLNACATVSNACSSGAPSNSSSCSTSSSSSSSSSSSTPSSASSSASMFHNCSSLTAQHCHPHHYAHHTNPCTTFHNDRLRFLMRRWPETIATNRVGSNGRSSCGSSLAASDEEDESLHSIHHPCTDHYEHSERSQHRVENHTADEHHSPEDTHIWSMNTNEPIRFSSRHYREREFVRYREEESQLFDVDIDHDVAPPLDVDSGVSLDCESVQVPLLLLGNKRDLEHVRQVMVEDGQELALRLRCQFYEVSAADSCVGVRLAFQALIRETRSWLFHEAAVAQSTSSSVSMAINSPIVDQTNVDGNSTAGQTLNRLYSRQQGHNHHIGNSSVSSNCQSIETTCSVKAPLQLTSRRKVGSAMSVSKMIGIVFGSKTARQKKRPSLSI